MLHFHLEVFVVHQSFVVLLLDGLLSDDQLSDGLFIDGRLSDGL